MTKTIIGLSLTLLLFACQSVQESQQQVRESKANQAYFDWFSYSGNDDVFNLAKTPDEYRNPILAGYHPDPSIVRVGEDFYLINSSFGFFPGIPIFHSRDLVNWNQIGNAITDANAFNFEGLHLGYNGTYAPAIEYRDGTFYIINTCIGCGGNFVITAQDPAGPWSKPIWMPHLIGIDPSIFFDDDGKTYVVHHRDPDKENKRYSAHTALWIMEVDPVTFAPLSDDVMLIDGGDPAPWNTDYHEGPHIYKVDDYYYLSAPGGGTGYFHQQLVYRAKHIFGPYEANPNNPILTQFGLPDDRENPVTATGHADLFEDGQGNWWSVFLGTRVFDLEKGPQDPGKFLTGRETFMLPVSWENGWPYILKDQALPYVAKRPTLPTSAPVDSATTGNFSVTEQFNQSTLAPQWLFVRAPKNQWWQIAEDHLIITAREQRLGDKQQPSFIGRRLAHMEASIETKLTFTAKSVDDEAGLAAIQNSAHYITYGLSKSNSGDNVLRIRRRGGEEQPRGITLAEMPVELAEGQNIVLRININKSLMNFEYSIDGTNHVKLLDNLDTDVLTTSKAGGFTGAVIGMYAETATK